MLRLSIALLVFAVLLLVLASPSPAAERFAGLTERGRLVGFTSESPYALLAEPKAVRGLAAGERLLALGRAERGVVAVGSSARLYSLDLATARATAIGPPFPQGLRGSRFSLAVSARTNRARLLSDVGQDLVVDLATGATGDGPGLRRENDGAQLRPAADMTPDGRLVGAQINPDVLVREPASGTSTLAQLPLAVPMNIPLGEPLAFSLGSDGNAYVVAVATDFKRVRQSVLFVMDPATGNPATGSSRSVAFFGRRIDNFTALGQVAPDRTPARVRVRLPRQVSARGLLRHRRLPVEVDSSEAGQVTLGMQVRGRSIGFTFDTRDTPGRFRFTHFPFTKRLKENIRAGVGARLRLRINVNDFKGNYRRVIRTVRLIR